MAESQIHREFGHVKCEMSANSPEIVSNIIPGQSAFLVQVPNPLLTQLFVLFEQFLCLPCGNMTVSVFFHGKFERQKRQHVAEDPTIWRVVKKIRIERGPPDILQHICRESRLCNFNFVVDFVVDLEDKQERSSQS